MRKFNKILSLVMTVLLSYFSAVGIYADSVLVSETGYIIIEREVIRSGTVSESELLPLASGTCYESQNAAMRAAKRSVNIPYSQDYISMEQIKMIGANGRTYYAVLEIYPDNKYIRNDSQGHIFSDGETLPRHYNSGTIRSDGKFNSSGLHFWY